MQNVAAEIEEKCPGVKTKIIDVDFAKEDSTSYIPKIEESIKAPWSILLTSCFLCQGNVWTFWGLGEQKKGTFKIQKSKIAILVLNQSPISAVFQIVRVPGEQKLD